VNLAGTPDPDEFIGTAYDDIINGGPGDDVLTGGATGTGEDVIDGGPGVDRVVFSGQASGYSIAPIIGGFSISAPAAPRWWAMSNSPYSAT
jgi:Ca2+-binding RTX toxin-like protein